MDSFFIAISRWKLVGIAEVVGSNLTQSIIINLVNYGIELSSD